MTIATIPLNPGRVTIDHDVVFDAAHIPDFRWNGFVCPMFTRQQAEAVVDWANKAAEEFPDSTTFEWDGANLRESCDYGDGPEVTIISPRRQHGLDLYDIADGWAWEYEVPTTGTTA